MLCVPHCRPNGSRRLLRLCSTPIIARGYTIVGGFRPACSIIFDYFPCISWHYSWGHWANVQSFLLLQRMFWIVFCIPFQVVMSTDTCGLFCSRFSHLPWLKHNSVADAALAMRMTEQILCFSFVLISLLQVSSLHLPASWPRNITGPSRLVSCFMRPTGQDSLPVKNAPRALGFRCAHCTSEFDTRRAMDCHRRTESNPPLGLDASGFVRYATSCTT